MKLFVKVSEQAGHMKIRQPHHLFGLINAIRFLGSVFLILISSGITLRAATVPTGFTDSLVAGGLSNPTTMAFAPDGRLFVSQQGGQLRVIKNGALLATPFLTVTTDPSGERGLLGIAFDPNFASNQFVYIYYTVNSSPAHNRVSRFTANGDIAVANSETVIFELSNLSSATNHNGGAMHFGGDGKLYIAVGENGNGANAQTLGNLLGKVLRINSDGTIPTDNPFFNTATGANRAIWTLGLRNPYTFAFQPVTNRMFINDVGEVTWEEINDGIAGSNYGWPNTEGPTTNPSFRSPLFWYGHGTGATVGCAITGGTFYNPSVNQFPSNYVGKYFFADFCSGWIRLLDPANNTATDFASGISSPVDLQVGPDGNLYYLARGSGAVFKVSYTPPQNQPPVGSITTPASGTLYNAGDTINYSGTGTDPEDGNLPASAFTWQVDFHHDAQVNTFTPATSGSTSGSFTIPTTGETSANVFYRITLTVKDSAGLTHTSFRDVLPRTSTITLATNPARLQLTLDAQSVTTPQQVTSVVGMTRTLGVVSPQTVNGVTYQFSTWSDAGAATHNINTPAGNTTYTANFTALPQTLQLSAVSYNVGEGDGSFNLTITRLGGSTGEASVDYRASGGTASEQKDYTTLVGTLHFAGGETSKTLPFLVTEDAFVEGTETVNLILSNPKGAVMGGQSMAVINIVDNDSSSSSSNPINQTPIFVRQHYHDFLNREPDPPGYRGWQDILNNCAPGDTKCDRIEVSSAFFRSLEFQQRGYFIYRFYSSSFGRKPDYAEFMPDMARVSGFQTPEQEEANKVAFIDDFMARQEFKNRYDPVTDPRAFVQALESAAGVVLANREALIADLAAGRKTRAQVLRAVAESTEVFQKYYNQAFVVMEYFGYLRRDPDSLYLNWIDILNRNGDYRSMVNGFINSIEYKSRFGQP
jgi:glucose/arabinose dehydrogenase